MIEKGTVGNMVDVRACNKPLERLTFRGVRSSKFRHVFGSPAKKDKCYENIKITKNAHDSHFCAVNPKFVAIVTEVAGGGAFLVLPICKTGRLEFNAGRVTGHRGPVLDIKWNPFNDNIIASCSDDCTVKLWYIPEGGLTSHLNEWLVDLRGHRRRVGHLEWHPTAENILLSAGFDHLVIVWDVGREEAVSIVEGHPDVIYCMSFNLDGSLLATTCKDKKLRIIEPRHGIILSEGVCHQGTKASKVAFLGDTGRLFTVGFSRHSDRQYAVWDQDHLETPLSMETIDSSSGVLFPYYDHDTKIIFLAGKGDGNVRYYEVVDRAPWVHYLNQFPSGSPQRGLGAMPKRGCDVSRCEIFRFYKLHATKEVCEPISMIVPRKSDQFQDDLFPDTAAPTPSLTAKEWITGKNKGPILISLKTGVLVKTHKPIAMKPTESQTQQRNLSKAKFAFLSTETVPDYRPVEMRQMMAPTDKSQKTSCNQNTKFYQIQQMWGGLADKGNDDDVSSNEMDSTLRIKRRAVQSLDRAMDIVELPNDLIEWRMLYNKQSEEIRTLKGLLAGKERIIQELEEQICKLKANA
ncbi:coronin-1A-like isoform X1 [Hetaerina americana]|uniref:coronin-1A-like isoform X1 n=1 Tax=Hetaerina americana TaxID=62018 RepID=UPI003A7F28A4